MSEPNRTPHEFNVDVMTCSFCPWKTDGHQAGAVIAWTDHMAADHPVYWSQRNAVVAAIYGRGAYDTSYDEACGRLAQIMLDAIGLTPDKTGEMPVSDDLTAPAPCINQDFAGCPVGGTCSECGHMIAVHIGCESCVVCRMEIPISPAGQRRQARIDGRQP